MFDRNSQVNFVLLYCVMNLSAGATAQSREPFSLQELIDFQKLKSLQSQYSQLRLRSAESLNLSVHRDSYPKLVFDSQHGRSESLPVAGNGGANSTRGWSSQFSIGTSWQAFDGGERNYLQKISDLELASTKLDNAIERQKIDFEIARLFFRIQSIVANSRLSSDIEQTLNNQFRQTERQFRQGLKTNRDYQRLRSELKRLELEKASKDHQLENLLNELGVRTGVAIGELTQRGLRGVEKLPRIFDGGLLTERGAMNESTEDASAKLGLEKLKLRAERAKYEGNWPEIKLAMLWDYGSKNYIPDSQQLSQNDAATWQALLSIRYELWDWGVKRAKAESSWETYRAEEIHANADRQSRQASVLRAKNVLGDLLKQYQLANDLLILDQGNFDLVQSDFKKGKAGYLDLIAGLRELSSSRRQQYDLYFSIMNQLVEIHNAEGNLDEWVKSF